MRVKLKVKIMLTIVMDDLEFENLAGLQDWLSANLDPVVTDKDGVDYLPVGQPEFYVTSFAMKDTNSEEQLPRDNQIVPPGG